VRIIDHARIVKEGKLLDSLLIAYSIVLAGVVGARVAVKWNLFAIFFNIRVLAHVDLFEYVDDKEEHYSVLGGHLYTVHCFGPRVYRSGALSCD
jgi:hypothetical protein